MVHRLRYLKKDRIRTADKLLIPEVHLSSLCDGHEALCDLLCVIQRAVREPDQGSHNGRIGGHPSEQWAATGEFQFDVLTIDFWLMLFNREKRCSLIEAHDVGDGRLVFCCAAKIWRHAGRVASAIASVSERDCSALVDPSQHRFE